MNTCQKCALLAELYEQCPKTPRNYWIATELIYIMHGSDVCDGTGIRSITAICPVCGEVFAELVGNEGLPEPGEGIRVGEGVEDDHWDDVSG